MKQGQEEKLGMHKRSIITNEIGIEANYFTEEKQILILKNVHKVTTMQNKQRQILNTTEHNNGLLRPFFFFLTSFQ